MGRDAHRLAGRTRQRNARAHPKLSIVAKDTSAARQPDQARSTTPRAQGVHDRPAAFGDAHDHDRAASSKLKGITWVACEIRSASVSVARWFMRGNQAREAYVAAGFGQSGADFRNHNRLLRNPQIKARIDELI